MGKLKKKRFSVPKPRPTGLPSVKECEAEIEIDGNRDTTPATLQTIIEQLQIPNEESKECACSTIAGLVSQPGIITALLKQNIIKILGPLVLDHSWSVRHRAMGALRNLSVDGGDSVCVEMVNSDVLTPLMALIHQFGSGDQFGEKQPQKVKDIISETYLHAFYILLNLCESSDTAVRTFNKENLLPLICGILNSHQYAIDLKLAIVEFLYSVTEENSETRSRELIECVQRLMACHSEPSQDVLMSNPSQLSQSSELPQNVLMSNHTESSQEMLIRIFATGVLINLEGSKLLTVRGDWVCPIVESVAKVLTVDVASMLMTEIRFVSESSIDIVMGSTDGSAHDSIEMTTALCKMISELECILKTQMVALEITTNLCCSEDDDGWENMSSSKSSLDDDVYDVPMEDEESSMTSSLTPLCISTELHAAYVKFGIVQKVLHAAQPIMDDQIQVLKKLNSKHLHHSFEVKQTRALLCINNLVSSLAVEDFGGIEKLYDVWQGLLQLSSLQSSRENQGQLEAVTSAMRAVVQKLAEVDPAKFQEVTPVNFQLMYEMANKCPWSEVQVNAVRMISAIGVILARISTPHPLLRDIGVFLLEIVLKGSDLWVVAESLDSIFDIFGEDHINPVLHDINLIEKLKMFASTFKVKINQDEKNLGEHYPVISTARTNLIRFIKYKSSRVR